MSAESKKKVKDEVTRRLDVALDKLYRIWNEIGIDEGQVTNRANTVSIHLCNLMDEMVSEEEQLHEQMAVNIQRYIDELALLCLELAIPVPKVGEQLAMVQREKELRTKLESLNKEKQERVKRLKQLLAEDQALCQSLCSTPFYVHSTSVPTREQLHDLEDHVRSLLVEKEKRRSEFVSTKQQIVALCTEMEYDPDTSFERDLICEDDDAFQLSTENMESLKAVLHDLERKHKELKQQVADLWARIHALWNRLELPDSERTEFQSRYAGSKHSVLSGLRDEILRCEQLKYENLKRFVDCARKELVDFWNQCYFSKEQRDAFLPFLNETYTEDLLDVHEQELRKMQEYYRKNEGLFSLIARREKLWKEMLEFEKKASDPNRFFNDRGGKLLMEEKARKKIMKDLPKVEEEVRQQIEVWEKEHGRSFLVEGVSFAQYIDCQWTLFREQKELEKHERQKNKAKQMEEEMIFGSKPTTPAKRRFVNTPTRTPLKARKVVGDSSVSLRMKVVGESSVSLRMKVNETHRTPSSVSRIQHTSVFHSPLARMPLSATKVNETHRTPSSVSRIQHTSVFQSPLPRMPMSATKTPNMNHTNRRRSLRQARRHLQESMQNMNNSNRNGRTKNVAGKNIPDLFSQTTVSSGDTNSNVSLATMGSYREFAARLKTSTSSHPGNSTLLSNSSDKSSKKSAGRRV